MQVDTNKHIMKALKTSNIFLANQLKIQERILLRTRHLEVHAEHMSLGNPPVPDATLPDLSFED